MLDGRLSASNTIHHPAITTRPKVAKRYPGHHLGYTLPVPNFKDKPGGLPDKALDGEGIDVKVESLGAETYTCDPRQSGLNPDGLHWLEVSGPDEFWKANNIEAKGEGWVAQVVSRDPETGALSKEPKYQYIPKSKIPPSLRGGLGNRILQHLGLPPVGAEIIVNHQFQVGSKDLTVDCILPEADERWVEFNCDGWEDLPDSGERAAFMAAIGEIPMESIYKHELIGTGQATKLRLYSRVPAKDEQGKVASVFYELDLGWLNLDTSKIFIKPEDQELNAQLIVPNYVHNQEIPERHDSLLFYTHAAEENTYAIVSAYKGHGTKEADDKEHDKTIHININPKSFQPIINFGKAGKAAVLAYHQDDGSTIVQIINAFPGQNGGEDKFISIKAADEYDLETKINNLSSEMKKQGLNLYLPQEIENAAMNAFARAKPIKLAGKSWAEIKEQYLRASRTDPILRQRDGATHRLTVLKDVKRVFKDVQSKENYLAEEAKTARLRYALRFFYYRQVQLPDVLEEPMKAGEEVFLIHVKGTQKVIHLDESNGPLNEAEKKAAAATAQESIADDTPTTPKISFIPTPFLPFEGKEGIYELVIHDPAPHAIFTTKWLFSKVHTVLTGQNLTDPNAQGTNCMVSQGVGYDQKPFFGMDPRGPMTAPWGSLFKGEKAVAWYINWVQNVPQSIFRAKYFAGQETSWLTGMPSLDAYLKSFGRAMVTGPNTYYLNPAVEGLFPRIIPGTKKIIWSSILDHYPEDVTEDLKSSMMAMMYLGLETVPLTLSLSGGGGVDNWHIGLVQRALRWNTGLVTWLINVAGRVWQDITRGIKAYYYVTRFGKIKGFERMHAIDAVSADENPAAAKAAILDADATTHLPLAKSGKLGEVREDANVGTWYYVFAKIIQFVAVGLMVALAVLPIPVLGICFLLTCIANSLTSWPSWGFSAQKVGINPKDIIAVRPKHIFFNDLYIYEMANSAKVIELMGHGKFRASEKSVGNRLTPRTIRNALWIGTITPLLASTGLIGAFVAIVSGVGLIPVLVAAAPVALGYLLSKLMDKFSYRFLRNPGTTSAWKSVAHTILNNAPFFGGILLSYAFSPLYAFVWIPAVIGAMAGGWTLFMAYNKGMTLFEYLKEHKRTYLRQAPNEQTPGIPKHLGENSRRFTRIIFGIDQPSFEPWEFNYYGLSSELLWGIINGINIKNSFLPEELQELLITHKLAEKGIVKQDYNFDQLYKLMEKLEISEEDFMERFGVDMFTVSSVLDWSKGIVPGLLPNEPADPLDALNAVIDGTRSDKSSLLFDLYGAVEHRLPKELQADKIQGHKFFRFSKAGRLARLLKKTKKVREKIAENPTRTQNTAEYLQISAVEYEYLRELNRLTMEVVGGQWAPPRNDGLETILQGLF